MREYAVEQMVRKRPTVRKSPKVRKGQGSEGPGFGRARVRKGLMVSMEPARETEQTGNMDQTVDAGL